MFKIGKWSLKLTDLREVMNDSQGEVNAGEELSQLCR